MSDDDDDDDGSAMAIKYGGLAPATASPSGKRLSEVEFDLA